MFMFTYSAHSRILLLIPINWKLDFLSYNSWVIVLVISNHSPDDSLNCTPLNMITITNHASFIEVPMQAV